MRLELVIHNNVVKIDLSIVNFALTALFLYMIVMQIKNRLTIVICLISGVLAAGCMMLTKSTLGLVISTIIASLIGFGLEATLRKRLPDSHWLWRLRSPGSKKKAVEHSDAN